MPAIEILHEDGEILVVKKEPGLLSQSAENGKPGLVEYLTEQTGRTVYPVHRLDRETGGVMVFAKTDKAAAALSRCLAQREFHKEYLAILTRPMGSAEGELEDLLFFDRKRGKVFPVKRQRAGVKKARLTYTTAAVKDGGALVRVFPETGRTHQIRVQFASRGCPLLGDGKYGGGSGNLHLFCRSLSFPHPKSGELLCFSLLPQGGAWDALLWDAVL